MTMEIQIPVQLLSFITPLFILEQAFGQDVSAPGGTTALIIKKLIAAVEEKGLTKDIYLTTVPFLELLNMRNALNQGVLLSAHVRQTLNTFHF